MRGISYHACPNVAYMSQGITPSNCGRIVSCSRTLQSFLCQGKTHHYFHRDQHVVPAAPGQQRPHVGTTAIPRLNSSRNRTSRQGEGTGSVYAGVLGCIRGRAGTNLLDGGAAGAAADQVTAGRRTGVRVWRAGTGLHCQREHHIIITIINCPS